MTGAILKALALELVNTELEGNRSTERYRWEVRHNIRQFFSWMEQHGIDELRAVGKAELFAYYEYVCTQRSTTGTRNPGERIARRTINGRLSAVKKVYEILYRSGHLEHDPFHGLTLPLPVGRGFKRRPFTEAEMTDILEQLDPSTPRGLRDRALFELIYSSGLRVSEAAQLCVGDVDLSRREIIVHGKGSRDRLVPISPVARDFLELYLGSRLNRLDEPVFRGTRGKGYGKAMRGQTISRRFTALLEQAGLDGRGRSTHAVRHATATHLLDHGADIRHIQELLGHKNIETTVRYTQVQTGGLQKVYRKYHPGEHELFEVVDEAYRERLEKLIAGNEKR